MPNLHAWVLMRSLKSKGVVEEVFNWRHHYFYVKSEGLKVLRDALGIVEENVVPITFKKTKKDHLGKEEGNTNISQTRKIGEPAEPEEEAAEEPEEPEEEEQEVMTELKPPLKSKNLNSDLLF